jgi:hypothetical protein
MTDPMDPKKINEQRITIIKLMQTLALSWNIKEVYILREIGFIRPEHPIHSRRIDTTFNLITLKGISVYHCADCRTILMIGMYISTNDYPVWYHVIESLYYVDNYCKRVCYHCSQSYFDITHQISKSKPYSMSTTEWQNININ